MKNYKLTLLVLPVIVGAVILSRPHPARSTPPVTVAPGGNSQAASDTPASAPTPTKTTTASSKPEIVDTTKHASALIKAHAAAVEVSYYLLATVSDPQESSLWSHATVQANRAWDLTTGSSSTTVAVIDSGFALNHEELSTKWATNSGEIGMTANGNACWTGSAADKKTNNCDDDGNGYSDDWRGYDFYNSDNNPAAGQVNPSGEGTTHGTMVAGVIAAAANNGKGAAGIDQNTRIMPLQVFSDDAAAYTTDLVAAIEYAVNNHANVINLSLGTNGYDPLLLSAVQYARAHNVFVVAASGNCALNDQAFCNSLAAPGRMTYPALYPEVFSVGATTSSDVRASYSSYGNELDMTAPGSSVGPLPYYTQGNQTSAYATASGTSFASPLVAGMASLLITQDPTITVTQLQYILSQSTDKLSGMANATFTTEYGYGRANAHRATLLGLAITQDNLLGASELSPREPSIGHVWRATTGSIANDESLVVGCRVFPSDICKVTVQNDSTYYYSPSTPGKDDALQYIFIKGSSLPNGTLDIAVHNHEVASFITSLTK